MSIYSEIKKAILLLERVDALNSTTKELAAKISELSERVTTLEAREDAILLGAEKAARNATEAVIAKQSSRLGGPDQSDA